MNEHTHSKLQHNRFVRFLKRKKEFLSFRLMDLFAIAAIVFAYIQFHDAKTTLNTLPTKYLEDFPKNMKGIIEKVIDPAEQSLTIISDYPIYGIYSNAKVSVDYCNAILGKRNAKLNLIFYNYRTRKEEFLHQFRIPEDSLNSESYFNTKFLTHTCIRNPDSNKTAIGFAKKKAPKSYYSYTCNLDKMDNFCEVYKIPDERRPRTCNEFFQLMNNYHEDFIKDLSIGGDIRIDTIDQILSSAFWLADNNVLAFSLNSLGKKAQESTFTTHDPNIIGFVVKTYDNLISE